MGYGSMTHHGVKAPSAKKKRTRVERRDILFALLLLAPCLCLILALESFPIIFSLFLTFQSVQVGMKGLSLQFAGLSNWQHMLTDQALIPILIRTLYFTGLDVGLSFLIGLCVALVLNEEFRGKRFVQVALIVPWAIPVVVSGRMFGLIFSAGFGILNTLLIKIGAINIGLRWLTDTNLSINTVALAQVWTHFPLLALFFLAAFETIPEELYDAAKIDGTSRWQRFRHVTIPSVRNIILMMLIITTIASFKVFDMIYIMTMGYADTMVWYFNVFVQSFKYLYFDYGATLAYALFAAILLLTAIYLRLFPLREQ
jgi:multiple sugar transport system permease protein